MPLYQHGNSRNLDAENIRDLCNLQISPEKLDFEFRFLRLSMNLGTKPVTHSNFL